ncbi:MAG: alpha/beta fold hydrolase [Planctomycetota bacterium]
MPRPPSLPSRFPPGLRDLFFFNSRWHELRRDGGSALRMHFVDEGESDAPPVVCVHGNPTWSFIWRGLIRRLRDDCRVIAPDHIGMGWSDKPAKGFSYRLADHIANLESLIASLGLKDITLVVHDWGGPIGLGYAVRHPENVRRIVITNTAAFRSSRLPLRIAVCRWPVFGAIAVRGFNAFARAAITQATEQKGGLPRDVAQGLLQPYDSWANRIGVHRFVQDIPRNERHPSWPALMEIEGGLERLAKLPMMFAWGMKDWCFAPDPFLDEFVRRFPDASGGVQRYEAAGHYLMEDAAAQFEDDVARFVAGQP